MDYLKELMNILQNSEIKKLPSQELINSNEDIALAVFKNFQIQTSYYDDETQLENFSIWYQRGNWGTTLKNYNTFNFWKKAVEEHPFELELLTSKELKNDFPDVVSQFLNDNTSLKRLFKITQDINYIKKMTLPEEEKNSLLKNELLKRPHDITQEDVNRFSSDSSFIETLLLKSAESFRFLSDTDRLNDKYIQLLIEGSYNYHSFLTLVPKEKQDKYIDIWLNKFKHIQIVLKDLPEEFQLKLLEHRIDLISKVLDTDVYRYKDIAINAIIKNGIDTFKEFNLNQLTNLFKQKEDFLKIKSLLTEYVESYSNIQQISKFENKIISIISLDKELSLKLKENIFYQLNELNPQTKIDSNEFSYFVENIKDKVGKNVISIEKANTVLRKLKNKLLPEILKVEKYPDDNLYEYLTSTVTKELKI